LQCKKVFFAIEISTKKWYKGSDGEFEFYKIVEKHGKKTRKKNIFTPFFVPKNERASLAACPESGV